MHLSEEELAKESLLVQVYDYDLMSNDDLIGEMMIPLATLATDSETHTPKWFPICDRGVSSGEVRLNFHLVVPTPPLPVEAQRIKQGLLEKKVLGRNGIGRWEPRLALFTEKLFILAHNGGENSSILDCVPVDEIETVVVVQLQSEADRQVHFDREAETTKHEDETTMREDGGARSFNIVTRADGQNGGRIYSLRVQSSTECKEWVDGLLAVARRARKEVEISAMGSGMNRLRSHAKYAYTSTLSQSLFALVIIASFVVSLVEAEFQPAENSKAKDVFAGKHAWVRRRCIVKAGQAPYHHAQTSISTFSMAQYFGDSDRHTSNGFAIT